MTSVGFAILVTEHCNVLPSADAEPQSTYSEGVITDNGAREQNLMSKMAIMLTGHCNHSKWIPG